MDQGSSPSAVETVADPGYKNEINRLASYKKFPQDAALHPTQLAEKGFIYISQKNKVKCFFCEVRISCCKDQEEIEKVHRQLSPKCPMVTHIVSSNIVHYNTLSETTKMFQALFKLLLLLPELLEAGFHYMPKANFVDIIDCVKCFCCGLELSDWKANDSPWVEHAKHSPNCVHVLKVMGKMFVDKTQQLTNCQNQVTYSDVLRTYSAKQFVDRCIEGTVPHYHKVGRRCRDINCRGITYENKHLQYKTFSRRRATLPSSIYEDKKNRIAIAGYFYSTENNCLYCYCCGDKMPVLNTNEIAAIEHARSSPQCGYLRREFGDQFVHIIQESEKCDSMDVEQLIEHLSQLRNWSTEQSVEWICKAGHTVTDSRDDQLEDIREEKYNTQVVPACNNCQKANSAAQFLQCCNVSWCVDCCLRKTCSCGEAINLGEGHF